MRHESYSTTLPVLFLFLPQFTERIQKYDILILDTRYNNLIPMAYHKRGGTRAGAGRPAKAPTKLIRIEENLADKIKELTVKLEPDFILSKWESVETFLLHNQPLQQQEQNNKLPDNLSEALLNDLLVELLEKIFIKFSPDDFISYWSDIDLTEVESVLDVTPEKLDTASIPDVELAKDATPEIPNTASIPDIETTIDATSEKPDIVSIPDIETTIDATSEKLDIVSTPEIELAKDTTLEKQDKASIPEIKTTSNATPQKLDRSNGTKTYAKTVKYTVVEFSDYKTNDGNLLTKEQADILQAVRSRLTQTQKKGLLIEALAGTGKSTILGGKVAKILLAKYYLTFLSCQDVNKIQLRQILFTSTQAAVLDL